MNRSTTHRAGPIEEPMNAPGTGLRARSPSRQALGTIALVALVLGLLLLSNIPGGFGVPFAPAQRPVRLAPPTPIAAGPAPLVTGTTAPTTVGSVGTGASPTLTPRTTGTTDRALIGPYSPLPSQAPLGPRAGAVGAPTAPFGGSSPSNFYVTNYGWLSSATPIGASTTNLIATGTDYANEVNFSSNPSFLESHGIVGVSTSTDSGKTWSQHWLGQATAWTTTGNPANGDVFSQGSSLDTGYGLSGGGFELWNSVPSQFPTVVSNSTGGDLVLSAPFQSICYLTGSPAACSNINTTYDSPAGIAVTRSLDGGTTWSTPVPVFSMPLYRHVYYSNGCSGTPGAGILRLPANQTIGTSLVIGGPSAGGKNYAYLAVAYMSVSTSAVGWYCDATNHFLQVQFTNMSFLVNLYTSSDGGATWGAPKTVVHQPFSLTSLGMLQFPIAPLVLSPHLTVGPAPTYTVHAAYVDVANISTAQLFPLATFNNVTATTWSAPTDIGISTFTPDSSGPDWFFNGSIPMITSDNWSSSSHKGNLYLVWGDNLSASPGGTPSIEFSVNGGGGWSTPATIATGGGLHYFNPSVSIQSNGTIWVTFLGLNPNNGYFRLYGIYSTNAGATWSGLFPITDQPSTPLQDQFALGIGSVVATPVGAYSFWSDCRGSNCQTTSGFFNWTWFGALVHPVSLSATTAGVQATVTLGGSVTNYNLPVNLGWDSNVSVTVSVTAWVTAPNGTWIEEFQSFGGASTSSSDPVTFSYLGGNLVAKYLAVPGSWIGGTLSPMVAGATLRIIDPIRGTINANLVSGSGSYGFNLTVPGGASYTVVGAAAKYRTNSTLVVTTQFRTTTVDMVLAKINGWIQGLVNASTGASGLAGATITVNGTMVPGTNYDPVTGRYNVSEPWGTYNVAISEPGFKAVPGTSQVTVSPGVTTTLPLALEGAWINGTVTPASALVKINGAPASLSFQGASANFVSALPGGTYQVVASLSGFSTYNQTYTVKPGDAKTLIISLTNRGFIRGVVSPAGAVVYVNGAVQAVFNGAFNVSELASATPYEVTAKSQGYETGYANITVVAGETSWINFTLMKPSTTPHNCTYYGNCTSTKPNTAAGGLTTLDLIGIGIVVLLVVVIAAVLLMRRGKSGGGGGAMPQSPSYEPGQDGGSTSSGSMMDASEPSAGEPPSV